MYMKYKVTISLAAIWSRISTKNQGYFIKNADGNPVTGLVMLRRAARAYVNAPLRLY